MSFTSTCIIME